MGPYDDVITALLAFPWLLVGVMLVGAWVEAFVGRRQTRNVPTAFAQRCTHQIAHAPVAADAPREGFRRSVRVF